MKNIWKILLLVPLILAVALAPVRADDTNATDAKTNAAIIPAPAPPTTPEPPPQPHSEHPIVGIDPTGVYLGGSNPVSVNLPNFADSRIGGDGITLIALVSVVAPFLFVFLIIAASLFARYRRNRMLHETLRVMIEKGVPIPPELIMPQGARVRLRTVSDLRNGLILLAIGAGLILVSHGMWSGTGLIVVFIGTAFLVTWFVERRENSKNETK
jgi:Domain of unknown function (DUF6249)